MEFGRIKGPHIPLYTLKQRSKIDVAQKLSAVTQRALVSAYLFSAFCLPNWYLVAGYQALVQWFYHVFGMFYEIEIWGAR